LRLLGHTVCTAHDGPSALSKAADFLPEVALLDLGMPGMDGYEVARRMRALARFRDTVLIAHTGWGQEEDQRRSRAAGFDFHLVKPVDLAALQELLGRLHSVRS
jgi:CheY-like chemotaxis protein